MWKEYNPSPVGRKTGDCAVRAVAKAIDTDWETAYALLAMNGFAMGMMPNEPAVFAATLRKNGFYRQAIPNTCSDCYTVEDFAKDNPDGVSVLATGTHAVTIVDGDIYDMYDSSALIPITVWYEKDNPPKEDDDEL